MDWKQGYLRSLHVGVLIPTSILSPLHGQLTTNYLLHLPPKQEDETTNEENPLTEGHKEW